MFLQMTAEQVSMVMKIMNGTFDKEPMHNNVMFFELYAQLMAFESKAERQAKIQAEFELGTKVKVTGGKKLAKGTEAEVYKTGSGQYGPWILLRLQDGSTEFVKPNQIVAA